MIMSLEDRIQYHGTDLLRRAKGKIPPLASKAGMRNALFDLCMKDAAAATQIFRFLDVFPSLRDDQVLGHVREYLIDSKVRLGVLAPVVRASGLAPELAVRKIHEFSEDMARSFIAGSTVAQAARNVSTARPRRSFTFDILGELTTTEADARKYAEAYVAALSSLAAPDIFGNSAVDVFGQPRINMSVKLSALDAHFDPIDPKGVYDRIVEKLDMIFSQAQGSGAFINFDTEHDQYRRLGFYIIRRFLH